MILFKCFGYFLCRNVKACRTILIKCCYHNFLCIDKHSIMTSLICGIICFCVDIGVVKYHNIICDDVQVSYKHAGLKITPVRNKFLITLD